MKAILLHRKGAINTPLLIDINSIIVIEPNLTEGESDGTIIVTTNRGYMVRESYDTIVTSLQQADELDIKVTFH